MINPYKRLDVFCCKYDAHSKFDHKVSVYHVLRVKNCYPQGCLYFKWRCQLLNKGKACTKGFKHVGKRCFGCKYFYDEKVNNQPQLLLTPEEYREFLEELEEFEDWLESIKGRKLDAWGVIKSVKPRLTKIINKDKSILTLEGYLLHFNEAYLDRLHWEDHCYAVIYADQQQRYQFAPGDDLEFTCYVKIDQGRLILEKIRSVDFRYKSQATTWNNSKALAVKGNITFFENQPLKCLHCEKGVLVDVVDKSQANWSRRRELYCLESFPNPDLCHYQAEKLLDAVDECQ